MAVKKLKAKKTAKASAAKKRTLRNIKTLKAVAKRKNGVKVKTKKGVKIQRARKIKNVRIKKTYLSPKELNYFKELIVMQKNEILENARRLRESLVDENTGEYVGENSTFSMHMAEHGTDEMEREKAFMLIQRDEKHLFYLETALQRIEKKTYGLCVSCGKPIDKGRLEAVPITQHCIKCKTTLSSAN
jgi:RNA polymerase-binding protein DksA